MGENANDLWKAMRLKDVEKLEGFLRRVRKFLVTFQKRTISKPNEPSIMRRTRSAILPMSIMLLRSLLHSRKVSLRLLPLTTVIGPFASVRVCFVYRLIRLFKSVVLPTPGGPTMATMIGGGSSSGVRLTSGT